MYQVAEHKGEKGNKHQPLAESERRGIEEGREGGESEHQVAEGRERRGRNGRRGT